MILATSHVLAPAVAGLPPAPRAVRLPESVYRRRRIVAAMIGAAVLTLGLVAARPDRVPPGEANPWPSTVEVSLPAELPGVYVVQPGDTLWDIALAIAPGADPRGLVHDLADAAGGSMLEPGQQIFLDAVGGSPIAIDPGQQPGQPAEAAGLRPQRPSR